MCVVSNIGDGWQRGFPERFPWMPVDPAPTTVPPGASKAEVDELRKEIRALKRLLKEAKRFDEATGQKDCEVDDKVAFIKRLADLLGVDMSDVFPGS